MSIVVNVIKKISDIFHIIGSVLLALIFIAVVLDVIGRAGSFYTIRDVGELSGLAVICLTFLAVPLALRQGKQIRVDLVTGRLGAKGQLILRVIGNFVIIIWCGAMVYWGIDMVISSQSIGLLTFMWRIPIWIVQIIVPVGMLFIIFETIFETVSFIKAGAVLKQTGH